MTSGLAGPAEKADGRLTDGDTDVARCFLRKYRGKKST